MAEVDRTTAVLSIRPVYADRILDGSKTIEFRRRPLPDQVETVLIWRTGKGGGFVGKFTVGGQRAADTCYWMAGAHRNRAGIDFQSLATYAGGKTTPVWGITISDLVRFPDVIPGWVLGTDRAPQSWRYASESWRFMLTEMEVIRG